MLSKTSSFTRKWPSWSRELFGHEYVLDMGWLCWTEARSALFVTASYQIGLDTKPSDLKVDYNGDWGKGRSGSSRELNLLNYAGPHRPPEVGPAEAGSLSASNLFLTLNTSPDRSPAGGICHCLQLDRTWHRMRADYSECWWRGRLTRTLLDYADHRRPSEDDPAEAESLSASNLFLTLNTAPGRSPAGQFIFVSASHQTGLDTRPITRRSIIVGVEGEGGRTRAENSNPAGYLLT